MKRNCLTVGEIKSFLASQSGEILVRVNLGRNKFENHIGKITNLFPAVFTLSCKDKSRTYSYAQVICGEVKFLRGKDGRGRESKAGGFASE